MMPGNVMAPEGKARNAYMKPSAYGSCQTVPGRCRISAPVQWISLAACPTGSCPYDPLSCNLFQSLKGSLLIQQSIQIMKQLCRYCFIHAIHVDCLTKVCLYYSDTLPNNLSEHLLIPFNSF